jgi:hypothetical protein
MKSSVYWHVTPCTSLKINRCFGETCRLQIQSLRISQTRNQHEAGSRQSLYILSRNWVTVDGVWIVTTSMSSAIANSYNLQFTTARTKSSQSAVSSSRCWVTSSNSGRSSAPGLTSSQADVYLTINSTLLCNDLKYWGLRRLLRLHQADRLRRPPAVLSPNC